MPAKKPSPVIEFVLAQLKKNPNSPYAEIVEAGKKAGHKIVPVVYGRARVMAGLSPKKGKAAVKKQAAAKKQAAKAAAPAIVKRGPGRPRKDAAPAMAKRGPGRPRKSDELAHLVARLQQAERLEAALRQIQQIVASV